MTYVFDPKLLREIAKLGIGRPHPELFAVIAEELTRRYPGRIDEAPEWFFNNAGGAMGMLRILYASWTEYLIFFGTPVGTWGHTGRYSFVEDYTFLLDGEMWYYGEGQTERTVYRPGAEIYLPKGQARCYCIVDHAWTLEYARGLIPTMLPFGLADSLFSTLDYKTVYRTFRNYGKHLIRNTFTRRTPAYPKPRSDTDSG